MTTVISTLAGETAWQTLTLETPRPPKPKLSVTPDALTFDTLQAEKTLSVSAQYAGPVYAISSNPQVATVDPAEIKIKPNAPVTFTVTAVSLGFATIAITDKKGVQVDVDIVVKGWTMQTAPTWRINLAAGVLDKQLYCVGGIDLNAVPTNAVESYDPATTQFVQQPAMVNPRQGLGVGVINRILYAVAGMPQNGVYSNALEAYNASAREWSTKEALPVTAFELAVAASDSTLYAVGGYSAQYGLLDKLFAYDPSTDTWTEKAPMPTARWSLAAGVINGVLYAVGGALIGTSTRLGTVEAYDPLTDTWTAKAPMPTARNALAVAVHNGKLYALGGADSSGQPLDTVEVYDPTIDAWSTEISMPSPLDGLAAGAIDGVLCVRSNSILYTLFVG